MTNYSVEALGLNKSFGRRLIFNDLKFKFEKAGVYGVSGPNGSGKSTLVKIIAGIIGASKGKIIHKLNENVIIAERLHNHIGFVSPYLVLYEEFSVYENFNFFAQIRGVKFNKERVDYLLDKFLLFKRKDELLKTYSSGMKQRVKLAQCIFSDTAIVLLDEPCTNLDTNGIDLYHSLITDYCKDRLVIVSSNDETEYSFCNERINMNDY